MRKSIVPMAIGGLVFVWGSALAQEPPPFELPSKVVPAQVVVCSFNDGQGPDDLDDAVESWTEYMDDNGVDDYAAWTLTPNFYGPDQEFDFIWLGAWTDGNAMGGGLDMWYTSGGEHAENFAEVADCGVQLLSGSINYKLPEGGTPANSVITFSNCNVSDSSNYPEVAMATRAWADALTASGSEAAIYHWFPAYGGGGDDTPDFVTLVAYPNYAALGADFERYTNGEMFRENGRLFGGKVECDVSRAYMAQQRRAAQLR